MGGSGSVEVIQRRREEAPRSPRVRVHSLRQPANALGKEWLVMITICVCVCVCVCVGCVFKIGVVEITRFVVFVVATSFYFFCEFCDAFSRPFRRAVQALEPPLRQRLRGLCTHQVLLLS